VNMPTGQTDAHTPDRYTMLSAMNVFNAASSNKSSTGIAEELHTVT